MKVVPLSLFIMLALLTGIHQTPAQGTKFFRISGPAATSITTLRSDGSLVWSNAQPGATYTVQTLASLQGASNWVDYVRLPTTHVLNTNLVCSFNPPAGMVLIPAGSFTIGDTLNDSTPFTPDSAPTNVTVSAFYMDVNLIGIPQWQTVLTWATNNGYSFDYAAFNKGSNYPAFQINWYDSVRWCNARSQLDGLTPVYYTNATLTQLYTNGDNDAIFANWSANGYRLPTEAEWEKAARGGLSGHRFPWGDFISETSANYLSNTNHFSYDLGPSGSNPIGQIGGAPYASPIATFAANGYGLYDMSGNLDSWCWDWYYGPIAAGDPYPSGSPYLGGTDPHGASSNSYGFRVLRGGNFADNAMYARCANRDHAIPQYRNFTGIRCVRGF